MRSTSLLENRIFHLFFFFFFFYVRARALLSIELSFNILLFVLNYTLKNISIFRAIYSSRPIAIFQITFKIKRSHRAGWIWLTIVLNYDRGTVTFSTFFHLDSAGLCFAKLCSFWTCLLHFRIFFFFNLFSFSLDTVKFFFFTINILYLRYSSKKKNRSLVSILKFWRAIEFAITYFLVGSFFELF